MVLTRLMVLVAATLVAVPGCAGAGSNPTVAEMTAYAEAAPATGELVRFFFYTHCGVESARIGGRWWHAREPLYGNGSPGVGPPAGWDDPYQVGHLTVESAERAVFRANGRQVVLVPAATDEPVRICR